MRERIQYNKVNKLKKGGKENEVSNTSTGWLRNNYQDGPGVEGNFLLVLSRVSDANFSSILEMEFKLAWNYGDI